MQGVILVFVASSFPICTALALWGHSRVLVLLGRGHDDRGAVLPDRPGDIHYLLKKIEKVSTHTGTKWSHSHFTGVSIAELTMKT